MASKLSDAAFEDPTGERNASVKWLVAELISILDLIAHDVYRHPEVFYKDESESQNVKF